MNVLRDKARRWVIDEGRTEDDIGHLIVVTFDAGPDRLEMHGYVNEARAEVNAARAEARWWEDLETAYRACGYRPNLDMVASKLKIPPKTLRKQVHDHGIPDYRKLHARFS